jgi:hypothetical protein
MQAKLGDLGLTSSEKVLRVCLVVLLAALACLNLAFMPWGERKERPAILLLERRATDSSLMQQPKSFDEQIYKQLMGRVYASLRNGPDQTASTPATLQGLSWIMSDNGQFDSKVSS